MELSLLFKQELNVNTDASATIKVENFKVVFMFLSLILFWAQKYIKRIELKRIIQDF